MRYIINYRNTYCSTIIDASEDPELADAILEMSYSSSMAYREEFESMINRNYITSLIKLIRVSFDKHCRYLEGSTEYSNLYISVLLSLIKLKEVYYDLSKDLAEYLSIILTHVKMDIVKSIRESSDLEDYNIQDIAMHLSLEGGGNIS